jgi:hypothetical protein
MSPEAYRKRLTSLDLTQEQAGELTRSEGVVDFFAKIAKDEGVAVEELEKQFIATHRCG